MRDSPRRRALGRGSLVVLQDDVLCVIRRVDEHWAEGRLRDRIGIFPISFVDFNDSAKWLLNNSAGLSAAAAVQPSLTSPAPSSQLQGKRSLSRSNDELASGLSQLDVTADVDVLARAPSRSHQRACSSGVSGVRRRDVTASADSSPTLSDVAVTLGILITTASTSISTTSSGLTSLASSGPRLLVTATAQPQNKRHSLTTLNDATTTVTSSANTQHRHSMALPITSVRSSPRHAMSPLSPGVVMTSVASDADQSGSLSSGAAAGSSSRSKCSLPAM